MEVPDCGEGGVVGAERVEVAREGAHDHLVHREDVRSAANVQICVSLGSES